MKRVPLTRGLHTLVSDQDFSRIKNINWYAHRAKTGNFYARSRDLGYLHCFILGHTGVDHRSRNTLDNRRSNLRTASQSQNMANARRPITNTSGFKGVTWHSARGQWMAQIMINKRSHYLGLFSDLVAAALAYDAAALKHFGKFACLNFPKSTINKPKIKNQI